MIEIQNTNNDFKSKLKKYAIIVFYSLTFLWIGLSLYFPTYHFIKVFLYTLGFYDGLDKLGRPMFLNLDVPISIQIIIVFFVIIFAFIMRHLFNKFQSVFLLLCMQIIIFFRLLNISFVYAKNNAMNWHFIYPLNFTVLSIITFWVSFIPLCFILLKKKYFKNNASISLKTLFCIIMILASLSTYKLFSVVIK